MSRRPVVVDGSNLATEGRSMPSLAQLDEAVRAWLAENPDDEVIVVVDASFSYRIDESERKMFEEAEDAGEVVSPPAGAVGRGDGFLLRIADRVDAAVLSNDSFQEFHGEYKWLFDSGRLLGGKPVPNVGWIFTPRTPVRGPKSRMAVRDAQRATKGPRSAPVVKAIAQATAEAIEVPQPSDARRNRRRGGRSSESAPVTTHEAVNEPLPFVTFIAGHPLGTEVEGEVVSFTSHGAFVDADGARCYVPVVGLGDPPPRTAKAVLKAGEVRMFVVQALDPPRRGIELALPEVARVAGAPTDETVEAEIGAGDAWRSTPQRSTPQRSTPQRSTAGIPPPPRGRRSPIADSRSRAPAADQPEVPAVEPTEAEAPVMSRSETASKTPRRSPRRPGGAPVAAESAAAAVSDETPTTTPEPAPARRSRRAAPAEPVEPVAPPADAVEAAPTRGRRKASAKAATASTDTDVSAAPATRARRSTKKAASADQPTEAKAPAPRVRRPAKKAAPVSGNPLSPIGTGELRAETTEKAPARAPRTTKRSTKAPAIDAKAAPTTAAGPAPAAVKRRVAKRAAAPTQPAVAPENTTAPTPRRRAPANKAAVAAKAKASPAGRTTKAVAKKVAPAKARVSKKATADPSADVSGGSAAPAKRTRRRST